MILTNRVIDSGEGWGVQVMQTQPFPLSVYVGGCQHGYGSVIVSRGEMAWRGRTIRQQVEKAYILYTHNPLMFHHSIPLCINADGFEFWWEIVGCHRIGNDPSVFSASADCLHYPAVFADCTELYKIAKEARKTKNGIAILDWIGEHLPAVPVAMLHDATLKAADIPELWRASL